MTVNALSAAVSGAYAQATRARTEATEVQGAPDRDRDADDAGGKAVQAPAPTVNLSGQEIGKMVNVTA